MSLGKTTRAKAIDWLRQTSGVNIVVHPDTLGEWSEDELELDYAEMPMSGALDRLCRGCGVEFGLRSGALYIASNARPLEKRMYDVRQLLERFTPDNADADVGDLLIDLAKSVVADESAWEREGVRVDSWNGALVVTQTADVHDAMHDFLTRLLNRGRGLRAKPSEASQRLAAKLAEKVSVSFDDSKLSELVALLKQHGVHALVHEDVDPHTTISLQLKDIAWRDVLSYVPALASVSVTLDAGMVRFGYEREQQVLRYYDIAGLLECAEQQGAARPATLSLLIQSSAPQIWEVEGSKIEFWGRLDARPADRSGSARGEGLPGRDEQDAGSVSLDARLSPIARSAQACTGLRSWMSHLFTPRSLLRADAG